jgi:hypothetical protein
MRNADRVFLGREPVNLPGERLARVRYAQIADVLLQSSETTLCAKKRDSPSTTVRHKRSV